MKEMLVIGIGSRIMMDDGVGICLVEDLKQNIRNPDIEFVAGETDIDYCLSEISGDHRVVVIDAFLSGKAVGEVTVIPLCGLTRGNNAGYSLHGIHFLNVIQCLEHRVEGILIGIEPYEINYGLSLSDKLQSCYPYILEKVAGHVKRYIELCGGKKNA